MVILDRDKCPFNKTFEQNWVPYFPKYLDRTHHFITHDIASGSEITPCNKIDKPLVVYRFSGNVMTSKAALRT